jgi:hypothetical protein
MPRKDFAAFTRLDASDVNTYLMDQSVQTFAGTATRGSAIATPVEGMAAYLEDSNILSLYDGTTWRNSLSTTGGILQVVSVDKTNTFTMTSTTFADVTGLSVTITPKSNTSKIFVMAVVSGTGQTSGTNFFGRLMRDSTAINVGDAASTRIRSTIFARDQEAVSTMPIMFLDSPATTSATTYKVQVRSQTTGQTIYVNRTVTDADATTVPRTVSNITVFEVSA